MDNDTKVNRGPVKFTKVKAFGAAGGHDGVYNGTVHIDGLSSTIQAVEDLIKAAPDVVLQATEFLKWFEEFVGPEALAEIKGEAPGCTPVKSYTGLVSALAKAEGEPDRIVWRSGQDE